MSFVVTSNKLEILEGTEIRVEPISGQPPANELVMIKVNGATHIGRWRPKRGGIDLVMPYQTIPISRADWVWIIGAVRPVPAAQRAVEFDFAIPRADQRRKRRSRCPNLRLVFA